MSAAGVHAALKEAYEDVAYVGRPNASSHPARLEALARLFGLDPAPAHRARVLEVGCGDGANLLPMAASLPGARFTGCDYSALLMSQARALRDGTGIANVELIEGDLREVAPKLGEFDYVIAHGFYSWVPNDVREAFVSLARRCLAPGGLVFVSYNILPGCHVRRIGWDAMRLAASGARTTGERLQAARTVVADLVDAWSRQGGAFEPLAQRFAPTASRTDSAIFHDEMSAVNEAVYFSAFVQHVASHGLGFLCEAELGTMSATGLPDRMRDLVATADPLSREQLLDFARLRPFRQSVLVRAEDLKRATLRPEAVDSLHFSAATAVVQEREEGAAGSVQGTVVDALAGRYPASLSARELADALGATGTPAAQVREVLVRGAFSGGVDLHASRLPLTPEPGARPRLWPFARWQAAQGTAVTNLRHEGVRLDDEVARAIAAACDGTRDRTALASLVPPGTGDPVAVVDHYLERFAFAGLFADATLE